MSRTIFSRGYVCAFPGCGKTTIYDNAFDYGLIKNVDKKVLNHRQNLKNGLVPVFDNDSSTFDKEHFPENLVANAISVGRHYNQFLYLTSTHENVRHTMKSEGLKYDIVFPKRELKAEYIQRYIDRGSSPFFVKFMDENWDTFIDSMEQDQTIGIKYRLESGQYLSDVLL